MTLLVFRNLRKRLVNEEGAAAVVREYSVRWHLKPASTMSCLLVSGLASLKRNIRYGRIYLSKSGLRGVN